jgi:hypothetical protein
MKPMFCRSLVPFEDLSRRHLVKHILLNALGRRWLLTIIVNYAAYSCCYNLSLLKGLMAREFIFLARTLVDFLKLHISVNWFYRSLWLIELSWVACFCSPLWEWPELRASHHIELGGAAPLDWSWCTHWVLSLTICRHVAHPAILVVVFLTHLLLELPQTETITLIYHYMLHHLLIWVFVFFFLDCF